MTTEANAYKKYKEAEVEGKRAEKGAEALELEGDYEKELSLVLSNRRKYEVLNTKAHIIRLLANNKNLKLFGN